MPIGHDSITRRLDDLEAAMSAACRMLAEFEAARTAPETDPETYRDPAPDHQGEEIHWHALSALVCRCGWMTTHPSPKARWTAYRTHAYSQRRRQDPA